MEIVAIKESRYHSYDSWKSLLHPTYQSCVNRDAYNSLINLMESSEHHEVLDAGLSMHLFKIGDACKLFGFSTFDRQFKVREVTKEEACKLLGTYWKSHRDGFFKC